MFPKVNQRDVQRFSHKESLYKIAQKVTNVIVYFYKQICCPEIPKITQSGHTV